jgi:hypothetical protein
MAPGIWDKIKSGFQKMKKITEDVAPVLQTMWNVGKPFFASQGVPTGLVDAGFDILGGMNSYGSSPSGPSTSVSNPYSYGFGTEQIIQKPWQRSKTGGGAIQYGTYVPETPKVSYRK